MSENTITADHLGRPIDPETYVPQDAGADTAPDPPATNIVSMSAEEYEALIARVEAAAAIEAKAEADAAKAAADAERKRVADEKAAAKAEAEAGKTGG